MNDKPLEFFLQDRLDQGQIKVYSPASNNIRYAQMEICTVMFASDNTPDAEKKTGRFRLLQDRLQDRLYHVKCNGTSLYVPGNLIEVSDSMLGFFRKS